MVKNAKLPFTILILSLIWFSDAWSQISSIDSLASLIDRSTGINKVSIINKLSIAYGQSNPDRMIKYSQKAIELARSGNFSHELAEAWFNLGTGYDYKCDYSHALESYQQAASLQEQERNTAAIVLTYSRIGEIYDTWGDYPKALDYHKKELELSKSINNEKLIALSLNNIGLVYDTQGKYNEALGYYNQANEKYKKITDKKGMAQTLLNIGNVNRLLSNFTISFDHFRRALHIGEEIQDIQIQGDAYYSIGMLFFALRQNDKSLEHLLKSLKLREQMQDLKGISLSQGYIGLVYYRMQNYRSALEYHTKALNIRRKINDVAGIATSLNNIGDIEFKSGQYHQALEYYLQALKIRENTGNAYGTYETKRSIGNTYKKLGDYSKALHYLQESLGFAIKENLKERITSNYFLISDVYSLKGDYKNAYQYLSMYAALKDSIFNKDYKERLTELQIKYDSEKSEKELQQLKARQSEQSLEIHKQRTQIYLLLAFALCGLVVALGFYYRYWLTNKTKEILELKNNEIASQKKELEELNATKDKFFSIISHDLKNPFNTLIGFSELLMTDFNELSDEEKLASLKDIRLTSQKSYQLLENLLEWSRIQTGNIRPSMQLFDIRDVLNECISLLESNARKKNICIDTCFSDSTKIYADNNIIKTVLRNLITNAIKFSHPGGRIKISTMQDSANTIVSVEDNGIGIKKEDLENLFKIDVNKSTLGTTSEKGTGLGLILCKEFIEKCGGEIWAESEYGKGTKLTFRIMNYEL